MEKFGKKTAGLDETIFLAPSIMHLTCCMLRIYDDETKQKIIKIMDEKFLPKLKELNFTAQDFVTFNKLNAMYTKDPAQSYVVFMEMEPSQTRNKILRLVNYIRNEFKKARLVTENDLKNDFVLHVTLMNTKYRKPKR